MSVYKNEEALVQSAPSARALSVQSYSGCFADARGGRMMRPKSVSHLMTLEVCVLSQASEDITAMSRSCLKVTSCNAPLRVKKRRLNFPSAFVHSRFLRRDRCARSCAGGRRSMVRSEEER